MTVGLDKAISQLDAAAALAGTELIEVVQSGTNRRATPAHIKSYIGAAAPTGAQQNDGLMSYQDKAKLDGIENGADVTDAANVAAAGAVMVSAIDDTPVNGETTAPISSNWAYDQTVALATEMDGRVLYDEELTRTVAYATDLAGQAARSLPLKQNKAANLTAVAALTVTDGNFIVGNGSTFVAESGATARASLGLGDSATKNVGTTAGTVAAGDTLATETDHRVLYDEELVRAVTYATDLAGQAARTLSGSVPSAAPASKTAPGVAGQLRYASGFLYLCVAKDTWKRVAITDEGWT